MLYKIKKKVIWIKLSYCIQIHTSGARIWPHFPESFLHSNHLQLAVNLQSKPIFVPQVNKYHECHFNNRKKFVFTFAEASSFPVTAVTTGPLPRAVFVLLQFGLFGSLLLCFSNDFAFYII